MELLTFLRLCASWFASAAHRVAARAQVIALELARTWWRPIGCLAVVGGIITNFIIVPMRAGVPAGGEGFAAVIAAWASMMAVREWGKAQAANQANQPGAQP